MRLQLVDIMKKAKIMIVEDEAITAMSIKADLSRIGYEICKLAASGEEAIKNAEQERPDVVLMDIILNGQMSGIEAAGEIRSRYDIPIIFMTGCEDESTKKLAEDIGPVEYFLKPVETEDIRLAIEKALQNHK